MSYISSILSTLQRMFAESPILNINIIVIIIAFVVMLWLFWEDFKSYDNEHKDFKSTLVSTGVLGTFIGILIGLWGFNTGDITSISESIPKLLDGLKTAFITSIFGMFLAILLSIIQKRKGGNVAEDEITALNNINNKLEKLDRLESIDTNILSVKAELNINQTSLFEFLQEKLSAIDSSLKEAVQTLSQGATEEIIKALEGVIQDFNTNLTEQFGDNFKQLNESVVKMIEWQNNYKDAVQGFEKQLKQTAENTEKSHKNTTDLIENFAKTNQEQLQEFIKDNNKASLENIEKINSVTTKNTDTLIKKVNVFSDEINKSLKDNVEQNKKANDKIKKSLEQLFKKTETAVSTTKSNAAQIKKITDDYARIATISEKLEVVITTNQNQIKKLEIHLTSLAKIGKDAGGITRELTNLSAKIQGSLSGQAEALTELTAGIGQQLPAALGALETTLTALTTEFAKNYEEFLKRFNEIKQQNNE